jgi:hypothetical protein
MSAGKRFLALRTGGASNACWATAGLAKIRRENRHPLNIDKVTRAVRADSFVAMIEFMSDLPCLIAILPGKTPLDGSILGEDRKFLEGKLGTHLKNVQPASVDVRVDTIFYHRINVVEHNPHGGIEIPVYPGGEISPRSPLHPLIAQIEYGVPERRFPSAPLPFSGGELFLRPHPVKNPVLPVIRPVLAG